MPLMARTEYRRDLWLYFAIAFAFSWMFWVPNALVANGIALPAGWANVLTGPLNPAAFGPLFSALLLTFLRHGGKGVIRLLKRGVDFRFQKTWLAAILLLPLGVFSGSIFASIAAGVRPLDLSVISEPSYALVIWGSAHLSREPVGDNDHVVFPKASNEQREVD
jgi:hypothetical protein